MFNIQKKTIATSRQKFTALAGTFHNEQLLTWFLKGLKRLPNSNYPEAFFIGKIPGNYQPFLELPTIYYETQPFLEFSCDSIVPCLNLLDRNEGDPLLSLLSSTRQQSNVMVYLYNPYKNDFIPIKEIVLNYEEKSMLIKNIGSEPVSVPVLKRTKPAEQLNVEEGTPETQVMQRDTNEDVSTKEISQAPDAPQARMGLKPYSSEVYNLAQLIQSGEASEAELIISARTILEHHPHHDIEYLNTELANRGIPFENLVFLFSVRTETSI